MSTDSGLFISLVERWRREVYDRQQASNDVDPAMARDWFDMAYGFGLACGLQPDKAYDFALNLGERGLL